MTSRLAWSDKTLDLSQGRNPLEIIYSQKRNHNHAASGKTERINIYGDVSMRAKFWVHDDDYEDLVSRWSWAQRGKFFSYALDSTKTGYTYTIGETTAGTNTVSVENINPFSVGDTCIICALDADDEYELVKISSVDVTYWVDHNGDNLVDELGNLLIFSHDITLEDNLIYTYPGGSEFRHHDYFEYAVILQDELGITPVNERWYTLQIEFLKEIPLLDADTEAENCQIGLTADSPTMTVGLGIATAESAEVELTADESMLTIIGSLTAQHAEFSHTADSPEILTYYADPQDASLGLTADQASVEVWWDASAQDASLGLTADEPTLNVYYDTVAQSASLASEAEQASLAVYYALTAVDASLSLQADSPTVVDLATYLVDDIGDNLVTDTGEPLVE